MSTRTAFLDDEAQRLAVARRALRVSAVRRSAWGVPYRAATEVNRRHRGAPALTAPVAVSQPLCASDTIGNTNLGASRT
jgi:hypothetical protein